eukprot:614822-Lingulodinium_polyedra.AAC.1
MDTRQRMALAAKRTWSMRRVISATMETPWARAMPRWHCERTKSAYQPDAGARNIRGHLETSRRSNPDIWP